LLSKIDIIKLYRISVKVYKGLLHILKFIHQT